jgi:restriction endonuclease S subunit
MKYPVYPAYKSSGVAWLGDIPAHWEVWKISHAFKRIGSGTTPATNDLGFYDGDIPWITTSELRENIITDTTTKLTERAFKEHSALMMYPPGTLLIAMYGATIGRLAILSISACTNQACCAFAEPVVLDPKFAFYWLLARRPELVAESSGGGQPNINQDKLRALRIPAPPLPEQRAIAAYLDRETARLDALVAKNERLIELLQEKRTALISHTVTRGLDANAPLKDSGVAWLGNVPRHWNVGRIRDVSESLQTGPFGSQLHSEEYTPGGIPVINPAHLRDGRIFPDPDVAIDEETFSRLARHELREGDIVFARRGEMGRCALVTATEAGWLCGSGSMRMRPRNDSAYPPFLNSLLSTNGVSDWLSLESVGTTMENLNRKIVGRIPVAIPPLDEQRAIAAHLDRETAKIDALIGKVRQVIEKLQEYRTALISAAVTGKMDVRDATVNKEDL